VWLGWAFLTLQSVCEWRELSWNMIEIKLGNETAVLVLHRNGILELESGSDKGLRGRGDTAKAGWVPRHQRTETLQHNTARLRHDDKTGCSGGKKGGETWVILRFPRRDLWVPHSTCLLLVKVKQCGSAKGPKADKRGCGDLSRRTFCDPQTSL
jgi:hypothetical protein